MKKVLFNPLVFFVSLIIGLFAAAICWESMKPLPEFELAPVVTEAENFEELEIEPPTGQDYDQTRLNEVTSTLKWVIENKEPRDDDALAPFSQVSNLLSLENVPWDDVTINAGRGGQVRMYHFPGFCLYLYLELYIPENRRQSSSAGTSGVRYIMGSPSIQIDGLNDPQDRIGRFRKEIAESVRRSLEEFQKQ